MTVNNSPSLTVQHGSRPLSRPQKAILSWLWVLSEHQQAFAFADEGLPAAQTFPLSQLRTVTLDRAAWEISLLEGLSAQARSRSLRRLEQRALLVRLGSGLYPDDNSNCRPYQGRSMNVRLTKLGMQAGEALYPAVFGREAAGIFDRLAAKHGVPLETFLGRRSAFCRMDRR